MNPQRREAIRSAYDAGETSFNGRPLFGPDEGRAPFSGGYFISKPRTAQGSAFVPDGTGGRTYTPTNLTKAFMPGPSNPNVRTIT